MGELVISLSSNQTAFFMNLLKDKDVIKYAKSSKRNLNYEEEKQDIQNFLRLKRIDRDTDEKLNNTKEGCEKKKAKIDRINNKVEKLENKDCEVGPCCSFCKKQGHKMKVSKQTQAFTSILLLNTNAPIML